MFWHIVTNSGEEHTSVFRVKELTKIGNCRFLQKFGITVPNYMASHLYVMFPNIFAAGMVWLPLNLFRNYKDGNNPVKPNEWRTPARLSKGAGFPILGSGIIYFWNVIKKKMWTVWNYNRVYCGRLAWKQANKSVESQIPVYITQAIFRLSNVCHIRIRVSKRGQLAYTGWSLLCTAAVVYAFRNSTKFKTGIRKPMVK